MDEKLEKRFGKIHLIIAILIIVVLFCALKIRALEKNIALLQHITWVLDDRCRDLEKRIELDKE